MKALISPMQDNVVVQVEQDADIFEVASPLHWVDCPDDILAYQYIYQDGQFVAYTPSVNTDGNDTV